MGNESDESISRVRGLTQTLASDDSDESNRRVSTVVPVVSDDIDESTRRVSTVLPVVSDEHDKSSRRGSTATLMVIKEHDGARNRCSESAQFGDGMDDKSRPTGMVSDESESRDDRCSMSGIQQAEQLATPVIQGGSIDTTVVNKHDIDECCVTNKCKCSKQHSRQMSNQWLSNTFSMITSGILGKSKNTKGKDFTEKC